MANAGEGGLPQVVCGTSGTRIRPRDPRKRRFTSLGEEQRGACVLLGLERPQ
jgi:hypothetical protein